MPVDAPSHLAGEGITGVRQKGGRVRGWYDDHETFDEERTPHPALRATFSRKGRRCTVSIPASRFAIDEQGDPPLKLEEPKAFEQRSQVVCFSKSPDTPPHNARVHRVVS
jgi:hypothetical protein